MLCRLGKATIFLRNCTRSPPKPSWVENPDKEDADGPQKEEAPTKEGTPEKDDKN